MFLQKYLPDGTINQIIIYTEMIPEKQLLQVDVSPREKGLVGIRNPTYHQSGDNIDHIIVHIPRYYTFVVSQSSIGDGYSGPSPDAFTTRTSLFCTRGGLWAMPNTHYASRKVIPLTKQGMARL